MTGGAGGPATATANGATSGMFDGSNWNVNFSGTQTNSTQRSGPAQTGSSLPAFGGALPATGGTWAIVAAMVVLGAVLWRLKK